MLRMLVAFSLEEQSGCHWGGGNQVASSGSHRVCLICVFCLSPRFGGPPHNLSCFATSTILAYLKTRLLRRTGKIKKKGRGATENSRWMDLHVNEAQQARH